MWFASDCFLITSPWTRGYTLVQEAGGLGFKSQLRQPIFFKKCLSQLNIELDISVAINLIGNLVQL
jgi:hypothetical protein